jgi:hypothetical protein
LLYGCLGRNVHCFADIILCFGTEVRNPPFRIDQVANQEAALIAQGMGVDTDHLPNMAHNGDGTKATYSSTSDQVSQVRRTGST